jgi:hypothetical protein
MVALSIHKEMSGTLSENSADLIPSTAQILSIHVCRENYMFLVPSTDLLCLGDKSDSLRCDEQLFWLNPCFCASKTPWSVRS